MQVPGVAWICKVIGMNKIEKAALGLLESLNWKCEGDMEKTPARMAKFYQQELIPQAFDFTVFPSQGDQMIVKPNIFFRSRCRHHFEPFYGTVSITYIPDKSIAGLSKLTRTVRFFSAGLLTQEQMTAKIADFLVKKLEPKGVMVIAKGKHLCECKPGVNEDMNSKFVTSAVRGIFQDDSAARAEAMRLMENG